MISRLTSPTKTNVAFKWEYSGKQVEIIVFSTKISKSKGDDLSSNSDFTNFYSQKTMKPIFESKEQRIKSPYNPRILYFATEMVSQSVIHSQ